MSAPRRAALLRRWLAGLNAPMPSREMQERIWREVAMAREDAYPCLRLGHFAVRRYHGQRLHWVKLSPDRARRCWRGAILPQTAAVTRRSWRTEAPGRRDRYRGPRPG
ncbi:TilS substrate-binding domain-containing protein [Escherichia coli]